MDIDKIKQRILDLAIRGKLVSQDPNDEPASVLIEKIKSKKEKMIKEGKIKPSKDDSYIYKASDNCYYEKKGNKVNNITSEIPFDIPNNWSWARLSSIGTTNIGLTYKPENICENGTIVLRSSNIKNNKIDLNDLVRVNSIIIHDNQYINNNDILICARNGSKALVGKCALYMYKDQKMSFGAFMAIFRTICYKYTYYYFLSAQFRSNFENENNKQINQVTQDILKNSLIPIPPLQEQYRICETIEKYFDLLNSIENNINSIKELVYCIKNKILEKFFGENSSYKSYYEKKQIEDISKTISVNDFEIKIKYILPNGIIPVVSQSMNLIDGYINESEKTLSNIPYIVFGDHTKVVKFINFPFVPGADGTKILKSIDGIEPKFLFYSSLYASNKIESRGYGRHYSKFKKVYIPVYPINLQQNIVTILDKVFSLIDPNIINKFYL